MTEELKKKIEQRAYEIFLKSGGVHGNDLENWSRAEREVMAEEERARKKPVVAPAPAVPPAAAPAPRPAPTAKPTAPKPVSTFRPPASGSMRSGRRGS